MKYLLSCLCVVLVVTSCIRSEAPNAEADILSCTVAGVSLKRDPVIQNKKIIFMVSDSTDVTRLSPQFILTEGATIEPVSGTARDFTTAQTYVVTSQDGNWKKTYVVSFIHTGVSTFYHFDNYFMVKNNDGTDRYCTFFEKDALGNDVLDWASGNSGFFLTDMRALPENYPTAYSNDGLSGGCVKLTTRSTGSFGAQMGMPIAAGNLFLGTFDVANALSNPLKATKFGVPFQHVPTYLTGYYKYKPGSKFTDDNGKVVDKADRADIYAIFYETDDKLKSLDGTNRFTHPNIISIAQIDELKEADGWTQFYLPFVFQPGKSVDSGKLKAGKYNIAIVFSSSIDGATFSGAVGSTLYIDEVELMYDNK